MPLTTLTDTLAHSVALIWTRDRSIAEISNDKIQLPKETDIHTPGGFQTRNNSKPAHTLDGAATGIGTLHYLMPYIVQ